MTDNRSPRRPLTGSRTPSRAPRRLAGQQSRPSDPVSDPIESTAPVDDGLRADSEGVSTDTSSADAPRLKESSTTAPQREGVLRRRRTTTVLAGLVGVAVVVLGGLAVLQTQEPDETAAAGRLWDPVARAGEFTLPRDGELPVTVDPLDWTSAVDQIAHSVTKVLSFDYNSIDGHEELAADLVTPEFLANDLRDTIAETAPKLKKNKAEYVVTVAGQSVISAGPDRVRALLFVNQLVTKGTGKSAVSDNYPLRLDVVGVRVDGTWLISSLNAG